MRTPETLSKILPLGRWQGYYKIYWPLTFSVSQIFDSILGFAQGNFQPCSTHKFIQDLALFHFVFDQRHLQNFLLKQQAISVHTDIIQFQTSSIKTFKWTHVGARPLGFGVNLQCGFCKRLKTKKPEPAKDHSKIDIRCLNCQDITSFSLTPGWKWVQGPPSKKDDRGAWLVSKEDLTS